jgi:hypothetical protein
MVNSILSALPTFCMGVVNQPPTIKRMINKYRKHCMWRGSDLNAKNPLLAAWSLATRPKKGGLGIVNLQTQNEALLLKNLHKFFNRANCPWVTLIWDNYYNSGQLHDNRPKGSFWSRSVLKLLDKFKGIAAVQLGDGSTVSLWVHLWNAKVRITEFPELYSFTTNKVISVKQAKNLENLHDIFQLPLTNEAFQQFTFLLTEINNLNAHIETDRWTYIWGTTQFSVHKAYIALTGHMATHPAFSWLWESKCQPKHKVFYWLLLHDKLNT